MIVLTGLHYFGKLRGDILAFLVIGVTVILRKDERLWDRRSAWEQLREQPVLEGTDDGADLILRDDGFQTKEELFESLERDRSDCARGA